MARVVKVSELINPIFFEPYRSSKNNVVLKGGRSSTKSSLISIRLVLDFLKDTNGNVICLRKVAKYLSTSVYEQIKWAIYTLGVEQQFRFLKSPLKIEHKKTNTAFYFYGVDDPQKLKSAKIAKGHVMALWFEELAEFKGVEDIDVVADTFIREKLENGKNVQVFYSYNPPRNPYEWINEWVDDKSKDEDYLIHHSTYLDDERGFLSEQMISKIEKYKETNLDYYKWMYLGEVIGLGDLVYNVELFKPKTPESDNPLFVFKDDPIRYISFATDTGHQVSATATVAMGITRQRKAILLDTYYYSPAGKSVKKAPSELAEDIYNFVERVQKKYPVPILKETVDSAEGGLRNQYYKDYGKRLNPVAKKEKLTMIDNVIDLMSQGRLYYIPNKNNEIVIEEHRKYQYDEKTLKTPKPKVIEVDDHSCDAIQYFCLDNARELRLKW